ncbi:MAG TPA: D-alanine--D-alanine ligase [Steroidobacteraceae bacterium]|nr:D-alanine--D-alanine ligase [Steroidobacteraceae bacterium]
MRLHYDPACARTTSDPHAFGRVAVLCGGSSSEREISLLTGKAVHAALRRRGVDAHTLDPSTFDLTHLAQERFARVWIALHGPGGEDGTVQGLLECLGIPYTGSGVAGSALGMDKLRTKRLAQAIGVATPDSLVLTGAHDLQDALEQLGLPLIVKPATQGSSVGMSKVERAEELPGAFRAARAMDASVFAERWVTGAEYTVAILKGEALPAIRIETPKAFYDYEAKYFRNDTRYFCPAGLSGPAERHLGKLALAAFDATGACGWGRVDFMTDAAGRPLLLEINTVPGMTDHSLVPMAAKAAGVGFDELVWRVLETSFTRVPLNSETDANSHARPRASASHVAP